MPQPIRTLKSFKEYITESSSNHISEKVYGPIEGENVIELAEQILNSIKKHKLYGKPLIYRGFSGNNAFNGIVRVTNQREGFYGALDDDLRKFIKKDLNIKNPTFASTQEIQAKMFGGVNIYVPGDQDRFFINPVVRDSLSDLNAGNVDMYKQVKPNDLGRHNGEILIDSKEYFLVHPVHLAQETRSKFKPKSIKTYEDLYKMVKQFINYWKWYQKNIKEK
jgi:hypothetical protein